MTALLEVREVTKRFGGLTAVNRVSFDVAEREPAADRVAKLTNVAWPLVGFPAPQHVFWNGVRTTADLVCEPSREESNVALAIAERWKLEARDRNAVIEIIAKMPECHFAI